MTSNLYIKLHPYGDYRFTKHLIRRSDMSKRFALLLLVLFVGTGFSQVRKDENRPSITLCWHTALDTSARYMMYFNRYQSGDTAWRLITVTKNKSLEVAKEGFKGDIAFGVKTIYYGDTSLMHTSLETTACVSSINNLCDTNCTSGAWYLSWRVGKPDRIQLLR